MDSRIYQLSDTPQSEGHVWVKIIEPAHAFYGEQFCLHCNRFYQKLDSFGQKIKPCTGKARITTRA